MNKHVSMKKKVLSFFLAFVILFSSMPAELFTFAFANDGTETTTQPAVSVKLSATPEEVAAGDSTAFKIAVDLTAITSADVKITLTEEEQALFDTDVMQALKNQNDSFKLTAKAGATDEYELSFTATGTKDYTVTLNSPFEAPASDEENDAQKDTTAEEKSSADENAAEKELTLDIVDGDIAVVSYEVAEPETPADEEQNGEDPSDQENPSDTEGENDPAGSQDPGVSTTPTENENPVTEEQEPSQEQTTVTETPSEPSADPTPTEETTPVEEPAAPVDTTENTPTPLFAEAALAATTTSDDQGVKIVTEGVTITFQAPVVEENPSENPGEGEEDEDQKPDEGSEDKDPSVDDDKDENKKPEETDPDAGANGDENNGNIDRTEIAASALDYSVSISGDEQNLKPVDRKLPAFSVTAKASLKDASTITQPGTFTFNLQLQLPAGTTLPSGSLSASDFTISTKILKLFKTSTIADAAFSDENATIGEVSYDETTSILTIPIIQNVDVKEVMPEPEQPAEPSTDPENNSEGSDENSGTAGDGSVDNNDETSGDNSTTPTARTTETTYEPTATSWTYTLNFSADVFEVPATFAGGTISASIVDAEGSALSGGNSLTIGAEVIEPSDEIRIAEKEKVSQTILWMDNNDEGNTRPGLDDERLTNLGLYFRTDGGSWELLDIDKLGDLGLTSLPTITVTPEADSYTLASSAELPTKLNKLDANGEPFDEPITVEWSIGEPNKEGESVPPEIDGYQASIDGDTWVYVQLAEMTFDILLRWGDLGESQSLADIEEDLRQYFALYSDVEGSDPITLDALYNEGKLTFDTENNTFTITGMPRFDATNNHPINYTINPATEVTGDMVIDVPGLEAGDPAQGIDGDKLTATYNNADAGNHGTDVDALYPGGQLILTLSGETTFVAYKEWLDLADTSGRPDLSFQLWRYEEGESYKTAAQVRGEDNQFIIIDLLKTDADGERYDPQTPIPITLDANDKILEKYSPEGNRYHYFVREVVEDTEGANKYEQIYGKVTRASDTAEEVVEDTVPYGDTRENGDTGIYYKGTISNRLTDTKTATLEKKWNAAAYQGYLTDVRAEFALEVLYPDVDGKFPENPSDEDWLAYPSEEEQITAVQSPITEESMVSWSVTKQVPTYGPLGREARYRWVETGVYQGTNSTDDLLQDGTFTLEHNDRFVTYTSTSETTYENQENSTGNSNTVITNDIAGTLDYHVMKIWKGVGTEIDGDKAYQPYKLTFDLYRQISGSALTEDEEPYLSFTWDGEEIALENDAALPEDITEVDLKNFFDNVQIEESKEDGSTTITWHTVLNELPRFDNEGREYEYLLLEKDHQPDYDTWRDDDGNYYTDVTNAPGQGNRILIRKEWNDDSDSAHRGSVTIQVYNRETNEKIGKPITLEKGVWTETVGIGELKPEEVYILETGVTVDGEKYQVPLQSYIFGQDGGANYTEPTAPKMVSESGDYDRYQYETAHHRYEATYSESTLSGEKLYIVNNRRLGNIDLTVTKKWDDGDGLMRNALKEANEALAKEGNSTVAPKLKLVFADGFTECGKIGESTVTLTDGAQTQIQDANGKTVSSTQVIDLNAATSTIHFYNLPKYEQDGRVVRYSVKEIWTTQPDGKVLTKAELKEYLRNNLSDYDGLNDLLKLIDEWSWSVTGDSYDPNYHPETADETPASGESATENEDDGTIPPSSNGALINNDSQTLEITNSLSNTKDVIWHKHWNDQYTYTQNQRPDLYLDIYRVVHTSANPDATKVEVVYDNYHWTADKIEQQESENEGGEDQPVTEVVDQYNWTVTLPDAQKYDAYGYEIFYYAVERTLVDYDSFDYTVGEYVYNGQELGNRNELLNETAALNQELVISKTEMDSAKNTPSTAADYPQFALREEGTFVNGLGDTVTIQGQKIWKSTPTGYPAEDLPPVTFEVYQMLNGKQVGDGSIATYQMDEWSSPDYSGTYLFTINHTGENNPDAVATQEDSEAGEDTEAATTEKLPRYTEDGQLYQYVLKEKMDAQLGEENGVTLDTVFDFDDDESNSYLATNVYNPPKGNIYVKKHLELPENMTENDTFPSIQFALSRTYTGNNGKTVEEKLDNIVTWTSEQVKAAWKAQQNGDKIVSSTDADNLVFEDLPIYAPNGSKYIYTATERIDDFLYGYTTVAGQGNLEVDDTGYSEESTISVGDLEPVEVDQPATDESEAQDESDTQPAGIPSTAYATFKNTYAQKEITLEGTKIWDDYGDAFGMRPENLTITVTRSAASQPGQNNAIAEETLVKDDDYVLTWDKPEQSDTWKYTITGTDGKKLDAYAPNGMPWTYKVTETLTGEQAEFYRKDPGSVSVNVDSDGNKETENALEFKPLKNSMTAGVTFEKKWKDKAGNVITDDYLGRELSVTFKAQVREKGEGASSEWQDAERYFAENMKPEDYQEVFPNNDDTSSYFVQTKTGKLTETDNWKGSFANLPGFIEKNGRFVQLEYRVVETGVKNIDSTQSISIENNQDDYNEITSGQFVIDAELAVSGSNSTTTNTLDLGSLTITKNWANDNDNKFDTRPGVESDTFTWQANFIIQRETAQDQWETLKNGAADKVFTIRGTDENPSGSISVTGLPEGIYRVIELQPDFVRDDSGAIPESFFVNNNDSFYNGMYTAQYNSNEMDSDENTTMAFTVTNTLNARSDISVEKVWRPVAPNGAAIDVVLQYSNDGEAWRDLETVTLNSTTDWTHTWTNLPAKYPANAPANTTQYRVVERNAQGGFILLSNEPNKDGTKFTITNVATTNLDVTKVWKGFDDNLPEKITVQLYRTMEGHSEETKLDGKTLTLNAENNWQGSFTNLEAYDAAGNEYTYFAREVGTGDYDVHYQDATTGNAFSTVITNVAQTGVTGTKTWKDNSNKYNTRPSVDEMVLTLYCSVNGEKPKEVENVTPEWSNTDSDQWTYTYKDLPKTDVNGNVYTYTVKETVSDGYELSKQDGYDLTNTLTGTVEVSGTKTWVGGQPEDLQLTLYRSFAGTAEGEETTESVVENVTPEWNKDGDKWTYTYGDLPKYDDQGKLYLYRVEENISDEYNGVTTAGEADKFNAIYTYDFTNVKKGALTVEKIVQGNRGETDRAFEFTVTLTGESITGVKAEEINDKYGDMEFTNGVATFTLKHGQSITASGLPAGLTYSVEETDANADGYTTSNSGNTGTIPSGDTAKVYFTNTKHEGEALTTSVSVQKVWKIDNGGEQPESVKVQLEKDGQPYGNPVTLSDKNGWKHEWKDLPLGFTWTVEEVDAPEGSTSYTNHYDNHFVITNDDVDIEQKPETVNVRKVWVIDDGGEHPDSVSVQLMRDGEPFGDPVTLNDANDWSHAWNDLESGHNWTVVELNVPDGFKATVSQSGDTFTIINDDTTEETTEIRVNKEWTIDNGGTRADSVTVQLYCDGQPWGDPVTLSDSNDWTTLWEELPVGHSWSVVEINVPAGFTSSVTQEDGVITITNDDIPTDIPDPERPDPDPEDPEPDDPTDIPDPEKPDPDPDDPEPEDPDDPTDIPDPEKPDTDDPDDPTDIPDTEKPDDNKDPDNPTTPSNPSSPSSPSTPSHSTTPGTSGTTTTTTTDKSDDKDAPQTGDNTHTRALFALCLASLAGMTVIGVSRKRQRKDDSDQS